MDPRMLFELGVKPRYEKVRTTVGAADLPGLIRRAKRDRDVRDVFDGIGLAIRGISSIIERTTKEEDTKK